MNSFPSINQKKILCLDSKPDRFIILQVYIYFYIDDLCNTFFVIEFFAFKINCKTLQKMASLKKNEVTCWWCGAWYQELPVTVCNFLLTYLCPTKTKIYLLILHKFTCKDQMFIYGTHRSNLLPALESTCSKMYIFKNRGR